MNKQAYLKLMKLANVSEEEDRRYTSSVNALAALLSGAGIGASLMKKGPETTALGGALTGTGLGGAAAYHLARLFKAGRTARILSTLAGGTAGGLLGFTAANKLDDVGQPVQNVRLVGGDIPISGNVSVYSRPFQPIRVELPHTIHTKELKD